VHGYGWSQLLVPTMINVSQNSWPSKWGFQVSSLLKRQSNIVEPKKW
jgi:hypothetical protein